MQVVVNDKKKRSSGFLGQGKPSILTLVWGASSLVLLIQLYFWNLFKTERSLQVQLGPYDPVKCSEVLYKQLHNLTFDPNGGKLHATQVIHTRGQLVNPHKFWISLHNKKFDVSRWVIMDKDDYYELSLTDAFIEILLAQDDNDKQQPLRMLDVGANIGFFTLLAASIQPPIIVDSFEPNPKNQLRFCESLRLNEWYSEFDTTAINMHTTISTTTTTGKMSSSQVNLYPYGVGKQEAMLEFEEHKTNPGQGHFIEKRDKRRKDRETDMQVITLDNFCKSRQWLTPDGSAATTAPKIVILKVDVEGLDSSVMLGAQQLLHAHIVQNVFLEVSARKHLAVPNRKALRLLCDAGYKLKSYGGWIGPNLDFEWKEKDDATVVIHKIMELTEKNHEQQLNLWWTL